MTQQPAHEYIRHGQTPFFRLPVVVDRNYVDVDAVLLGIPWDGGTTNAPGARMAPWAIRRASALFQTFHPFHRVDVFRAVRAVDGGNVAVTPFLADIARAAIEDEVGAVLAAGAVPFVVGGDHSIALPVMRALAQKHGELAVVHVDAHLDTSGPEVWGDGFHHGTPIRNAIREKLVARGALHQVAVRATWGSPEDGEVAGSHDARLWDMDTIDDLGVAEVASRIADAIGRRPTYVTFDVDGVDPAFAPGTGTPVAGGLVSREAIRLLRELAGINLVGMDVVEVCPERDVGDATATLAAQLLYEGMALLAARPR